MTKERQLLGKVEYISPVLFTCGVGNHKIHIVRATTKEVGCSFTSRIEVWRELVDKGSQMVKIPMSTEDYQGDINYFVHDILGSERLAEDTAREGAVIFIERSELE